jgi:hypothetical protein
MRYYRKVGGGAVHVSLARRRLGIGACQGSTPSNASAL